MKVSLPPRVPLEMDNRRNNLDDTCNVNEMFSGIFDELSQNTYNIQPLSHRLTHTADAAEIVVNNQHHP